MAELKTQPTNVNPEDFIAGLDNERRRMDATALLQIFKRATGLEPKMWGTAIIGYGMYHNKSTRSTQEGDWPLVAFSPRKQNLTLYVDPLRFPEFLQNLGKHKTSVACLYINKLDDVNLDVLEQLVTASYIWAKKEYKEAA
jgi:hypothetical protein